MYTNSDCTVYNRRINHTTRQDVWDHTQIRGVFWDGNHEHKKADKGSVDACSVHVLIPANAQTGKTYKSPKAYASAPSGAYTLSPGDIIVKGLVNHNISANYTIANLLRDCDDAYTIAFVEDNRYGSLDMQHFAIKG